VLALLVKCDNAMHLQHPNFSQAAITITHILQGIF